jgi:TatD DNase family protein
MKAVDAHAHLDFDKYDEDREEVVERAKEELEFVVNAGCNFERNRRSLDLEEGFPDTVVANIGLHPTFESDFDQLEDIKAQIRGNDPVAIGEIGLDHHHVTDQDVREEQEEVFRELLELAEELGKPVVVHTREAEKKSVDILDEYDLEGVMLHCFNGKPELVEEAVSKGMKIGVTTQVLYSTRVQSIVEKLDISDIFLETDSPFLYRGSRNEPVNVIESAEKIADIKDVNREEVVETTTLNASRFFQQDS